MDLAPVQAQPGLALLMVLEGLDEVGPGTGKGGANLVAALPAEVKGRGLRDDVVLLLRNRHRHLLDRHISRL